MTINFENYGRFYLTINYSMGQSIDYRNDGRPHTAKECADFIEYRMGEDTTIVSAIICDWDTGEVVAVVERDNEDFIDDCDWGYNEDMGYDPYLGCYTDDC